MTPANQQFNRGFGRGWDKRPVHGIPVPGVGPVPAYLMLISERPGKQDVLARPPQPFASIGGVEMIRYMGAGRLRMDEAYVTCMVKQYTEADAPSPEEIERDRAELDFEIDMACPYIIGALGKYVTQRFFGSVDMDVVHGIPRIFPHPTLGDIIVVPILHPAVAFYNADSQSLVLEDFKALGKVVRGELQPVTPGQCEPWEAVNDTKWMQYKLDRYRAAAFDTEGWLHNPWGLSVCDDLRTGYVARKKDHSVVAISHGIGYACKHYPEYRIYLHNALHDLPILDGLGVHLPYDRIRDTMILAYLLGTEPQGLKALAYRHCNMIMHSYEEVVKPYYDAVFQEWIRTAAEIPDLPEYSEEYCIVVTDEHGVSQAKVKKPWGMARHLRKMLKDYDKAIDNGEEFDFSGRWSRIDDFKKDIVYNTIGEPPELALDFVPDEEAIPYSGCDAVATRRIGPKLELMIKQNDLEEIARIDHAVVPMFDRMQRVGCLVDPEHFDRLASKCTDMLAENREKIYRMTGCNINVDSGDQVAALLFDNLKLDKEVTFKIAKTEAGDRLSTNDKILEALRFTHDVVGLVCDGREISKVRSSFCWPLARYSRRSKDRRIHPRFKLTRVSSGRPACADPNLLAIPTRSALGKEVRSGFIAKPGCVLADWDLSQIEMRYMADESQDPKLMMAFWNDIDVHDMTGSAISGYPLEQYQADKPTRKKWRDPAKRVNFGVITGITEVGLVAQMRLANATKNGKPLGQGGEAWTEPDCASMIGTYFSTYGEVRNYLDRCRAEAIRNGLVRSRRGRIRLLPGANSPVARVREEALRQSHSHKIQAGAAELMKIAQANIWEWVKIWQDQGRYIEPLLQVYDELLFEMEDDKAFKEEVDEVVVDCLINSTQLSVPLGAEGGFGANWTEAKG